MLVVVDLCGIFMSALRPDNYHHYREYELELLDCRCDNYLPGDLLDIRGAIPVHQGT